MPVDDLLAVLSFEEPIVPGLTHLGGVRRSDTRPAHTVINGENFHALHALLATHAGKVDVIYIDPPYNTGDPNWKYNNRFVDDNDSYAHSKWLSFMERRLKLAKELLTDDGVLIVTIDEHEVHHLGVLLEQLFPSSDIQMVTSVINPSGSSRQDRFSRSDEHIFFVFRGSAAIVPSSEDMLRPPSDPLKVRWDSLRRRGNASRRSRIPSLFYPIYFSSKTGAFVRCGEALPDGVSEAPEVEGTVSVLPVTDSGTELTWNLSPDGFVERLSKDCVRYYRKKDGEFVIMYLQEGTIDGIDAGKVIKNGVDEHGFPKWTYKEPKRVRPLTTWNKPSHSAGDQKVVLRSLVPGREFPYPKSLYAVEDTLRFIVGNKPQAVVLDFFVGTGTTSHAVFRLNRADGGSRRSIAVTNNEVSDEEIRRLRKSGVAPGDSKWEERGIFEYITRPRLSAAVSGRTSEGEPVAGEYRFTDESPMSDGFKENVEFFRLDYLTPDVVRSGHAFAWVIPLLWMQAGSVGQWDPEPGDAPWSMPESSNYGVLFNPDEVAGFMDALADRDDVTHIWVDTSSQAILRQIRSEVPPTVHVARLYDDYLRDVDRKPRRALQ